MDDVDLHSIRFPMRDGDVIVWAQVSLLALQERAARDGLPANLTKRELFDLLRDPCEEAASVLYAAGKVEPNGPFKIIRVPNGKL